MLKLIYMDNRNTSWNTKLLNYVDKDEACGYGWITMLLVDRALLSSWLTWETWENEIGLRILVWVSLTLTLTLTSLSLVCETGGKSYALPWDFIGLMKCSGWLFTSECIYAEVSMIFWSLDDSGKTLENLSSTNCIIWDIMIW